MRKGLSVVPHVRAGTRAAPGVRETSFPSPKVAILQTKYRGRLKDRQVRGDGIEHVRRQSRRKQRVLKSKRTRPQRIVMLVDVDSDFTSIVPNRGIKRP